MAKTVKMCNMNKEIAATVFMMLNNNKVVLKKNNNYFGTLIVTDTEPKDLVYPEGWYYSKGWFLNKPTSPTGIYHKILMVKSNGFNWECFANYSTRD